VEHVPDYAVFGLVFDRLVLTRKRPHLPAMGDCVAEGPRLSLITALPLGVWQEHLTALLHQTQVVRLRVVCKALKVLAMQLPMKLYIDYRSEAIEAALTCLPATKDLSVLAGDDPLEAAEESRMVEFLRGYGGTLTEVMPHGEAMKLLVASAVRAGALPKLTFIILDLQIPDHRQILSGRMLQLLEIAELTLDPADGEQLAVLEHLRHIPRLRSIVLDCGEIEEIVEGALLPFIPPSLKILNLDFSPAQAKEALLRDLPSLLRASGASLEEIEIEIPSHLSAQGGAAIGQVLRACSSTLKSAKLTNSSLPFVGNAYIRELVPGIVRCCETLERLHCHWAVFSALPATCHSFPCLTELTLGGGHDEDIAFTPAVWDIIANGGVPTLTSFSTNIICMAVGPEETVGRLARALEAVAGTLGRLSLFGPSGVDLPAGTCYELGAAMGKPATSQPSSCQCPYRWSGLPLHGARDGRLGRLPRARQGERSRTHNERRLVGLRA
jgi:hypothetical protein